jgi:hypothetical protein
MFIGENETEWKTIQNDLNVNFIEYTFGIFVACLVRLLTET